MTKTFKLALVGAGKIAESFHLPAWREIPDAEVVCLVDPRLEAAEALAKIFSIPGVYTSLEEALEKCAFDAVEICSPNALHAEQARLALLAGKHTLVEKPLATRSQDIAELIRLAKTNNLFLMCAQHQRFRPPTELAKKLIDDGEFGEIYWVKAEGIKSRGVPTQNESFTKLALAGGGPLFDLGSHLLDLGWWLAGRPEPTEIFASSFQRLAKLPRTKTENLAGPWQSFEIEEAAEAMIKFANGAHLSLAVSYLLNAEDSFRITFFGTKGSLEWPKMIRRTWTDGKILAEAIHFEETHRASQAELAHFVACAQERAESRVPVEDSLCIIKLIERAYASIERGKSVSWD